MNRLNVLHWHLIDSHSFPLELSSFPLLHQNGSWNSHYKPQTPKFKATYSAQDIMDLVKYAAVRGVRVMPEVDTPSHVTSWGSGIPGFLACEELHFAAHAIDPTREQNIDVVKKVLAEVSTLFPDKYMHLGADEMNFDCWREQSGSKVLKWATDHQMTLEQLLRDFEEKVIPITEALGRTAVLYADPVGHNIKLPASAVLQVWMVDGAKEMIRLLVGLKHQIIVSAGWYLDMQTPSLNKKKRYGFEDTWRDFYLNDPVEVAELSTNEASFVLGGEVCMWGEQVDDMNAIQKAFPRTSAAAERLWSSPGCGVHCQDTDETLTRLVRFRCLMVLAGINAGPLAPDYCPYVYRTHQPRPEVDSTAHSPLFSTVFLFGAAVLIFGLIIFRFRCGKSGNSTKVR
eukprot:c14671_g1_i1.p1 GENE.c14671_g1_i1~~c14671_g1_i1.p1  ORF type:complete len:399 (+),score=77.10 c14671_g1_i1:403-1599(+)